MWIDDLDGLLGLVEMDAVELHPWNATIDDVEHADRLVLDLDPGEGVPWQAVVEAALSLRRILEAAGLESWPKVTGGKGIHLMTPLASRMTHDEVRQLARSLAQCLMDAEPHRCQPTRRPEKAASSSTICATAGATPPSGLFLRERGRASPFPILSHGDRLNEVSGQTPSHSPIPSDPIAEGRHNPKFGHKPQLSQWKKREAAVAPCLTDQSPSV